jgi:putative iron-only hydrogenase system regulator
MEKDVRIASALITVEKHNANIQRVNQVLSDFSDSIIARQGLSLPSHHFNIITIILQTEVNTINSFAGKIGRIPEVEIKVLMHKCLKKNEI